MTSPINSVIPVITGSVVFGQTLAMSNGTWDDPASTFAYAWFRSGVAITGATTSIYTITRADIGYALVGRVTATNVDGSTNADSAATISVPSTLIVEDGTIVANADAYATLVYIADYHEKLGNAAWAALANDATREGYVRKATAYMTQMYIERWKGYRVISIQSLDWPRAWVELPASVFGGYVDQNTIPNEVKNACAELALKAKADDLMPDQTQNVKEEIVGPITIKYSEFSPQMVRYSSIDAMLSPYLNSNGGVSVQLVK